MLKLIFEKIFIFLCTVFYKTKNYLYFGNFSKKHFTFSIINGKIQITSTEHTDFIAATQKEINKLSKTKDQKDFIKLALTQALDGCNFIIFYPVGESDKFVQFWTGDHQLKYNFYANKVNKLKNCFLSIIGLLSELGFVNSIIPEYKGLMVFKIDKGTDYISVDANFYKDIDLATEFTDLIFKQIYKIKGNKLVAKVE